ncbi:tetratricopeptide repeat protein [candidate division WOR-3 bacterium]|nr:tetratricopeptide repeat protein [candidate division WOR-3 bacterium]
MENINFEKRVLIFRKKGYGYPIFFLFIILLSAFGCTKVTIKKKQLSDSALQHYTLGLYYQQNDEDSLAVEEFKQALFEDPENSEFLSELAFSLSKIGNYEEAEKYAEAAVKHGAADANLYVILGNREKERGEMKRAVSLYKKALNDTTNYLLVINLAQLMRDLNMIDDAIELLKKLKGRYPFDLRIHTQLGDLYGRAEKFDRATLEFKEALFIDSLYYPAILGLGIIYEIKGDVDSSLVFYKKASLLNPNNIRLLKRIVEFNLVKREWLEARDCALTILDISPTENTVRKQLAYAFYRMGDSENSFEHYLLLSGLLPNDASVHHFLGRLYNEKKEIEKAEEEFNFSLKLNPDFTPNLEYLYIISIKDENEEKAAHFFEELKKKGIKEENIFFSVGTNLYREREYLMAKSLFLKSIAKNPEFPGPWYSLGFVYDKLGDLDSAEYSYRKLIELDSMNADAFNALGYLYVEHNMKLEEAKGLITHALLIDSLNGYYIDSLGWLYFKLKNYEKAKEFLLKAKERAKDPVIYEHLGDVYEKLGDKERAREEWQRALELDPENEEIKKKLEPQKNTE